MVETTRSTRALNDSFQKVQEIHQFKQVVQAQPLFQFDAFQSLVYDHQWSFQLYDQFTGTNDPLLKKMIMNDLLKHLVAHIAIEEAIIDPLYHYALDAGDELALRSSDDHEKIRSSIRAIYSLDTGHPNYITQAYFLINDLKQHVVEEEPILKKLRETLSSDQINLLNKIVKDAKRIVPHRDVSDATNNWLVGEPARAFDMLLLTFRS